MGEVLSWIAGFLVIALGIVPVVVGLILRVVCSLKSSCKWKGCPFRWRGDYSCLSFRPTGCVKCPWPYDEQEYFDAKEEVRELRRQLKEYEKKYCRESEDNGTV